MGRSRRKGGSSSTLRGDVIEGEGVEIVPSASKDGSSKKDDGSKERTSPVELEYDLRVYAEGCCGAEIKGLAKSFAAPTRDTIKGSRTLLGTVRVRAGLKLTVQPLPDQAWKFTQWMGDGQGSPYLEVEMDGDKEVIVVAEPPEKGHKDRRKKIRLIQKKRAARNKPRLRVRLYDGARRPRRSDGGSSSGSSKSSSS